MKNCFWNRFCSPNFLATPTCIKKKCCWQKHSLTLKTLSTKNNANFTRKSRVQKLLCSLQTCSAHSFFVINFSPSTFNFTDVPLHRFIQMYGYFYDQPFSNVSHKTFIPRRSQRDNKKFPSTWLLASALLWNYRMSRILIRHDWFFRKRTFGWLPLTG